MKKVLLAALTVCGVIAAAGPSMAQSSFEFNIESGPRYGYDYQSYRDRGSDWDREWRHSRPYWSYDRPRYWYRPAPPPWAPAYGSRRDWDGDGVPNRYDARPRNPWRY